ncbi:tetratricopeptide repeat protein [Nitrospira sp. Kam-Ns4a]
MRGLSLTVLAACLAGIVGCAAEKPAPRMPLPLGPGAPQPAVQYTLLGTTEYKNGQLNEARTHFEQAVAAAASSGEAHYNLGLVLYALGENEQAREHFIEAANLAPGHKVIWDSPALRPFGSPEPSTPKKPIDSTYSNRRPTFGGGPRQ